MFKRFSGWEPSHKLIAVSAIGLTAFTIWAGFAQVDEVTRGSGKVIPTSKAQLVQPAEPATVAEILVRAGQRVKRGQPLVRLDDARSASELGQLQTENERLAVKAQRLQQEAMGGSLGCKDAVCADERNLQQARVDMAQAKQRSLTEAVEQRRRDLQEAQATANSLEGSVRLARQQVDMLAPLAKQNIVPQTELLSAQRDLVDAQGRLSAARQAAGRASAAIRQAQADVSSAKYEFRQDALKERSDVTTRMAINQETIRGAAARQQRNELRSPADGIVNDLQVTTVGGFVNAGEKIMQIVPVGDKLLVEAHVAPSDIAFIKVGDRANVKVTAYDFSIYGGLSGRVQQVSADSIFDDVKKEAYYAVLVETDKAYISRNGQRLPIVPGMICDVEIVTGHRSILRYLFKPVNKALSEAMTER